MVVGGASKVNTIDVLQVTSHPTQVSWSCESRERSELEIIPDNALQVIQSQRQRDKLSLSDALQLAEDPTLPTRVPGTPHSLHVSQGPHTPYTCPGDPTLPTRVPGTPHSLHVSQGPHTPHISCLLRPILHTWLQSLIMVTRGPLTHSTDVLCKHDAQTGGVSR